MVENPEINCDRVLRPLDGEIFVVDKPLGWSSFHVVKKLRGALAARLRKVGVRKLKVGHAGTLDPLATGVMIICSGKATKRIDELQAGVKEYVATMKLGATTPSFDLETPVDAIYQTGHSTRELVEEMLPRFKGRIEQIPPTYSACKVDGDRAYKKARRGESVELKPKVLEIEEIELLEFKNDEIKIRVVCGKGTYIRALARDIGEALDSGAHLTALRRTRVGEGLIGNALSIEDAVRLISTRPMVVADEDGNDVPVGEIGFDAAFMLNEKADIKSYAERLVQDAEESGIG